MGVAGSVSAEPLDWFEPSSFFARHSGRFRWVLGSDIVYHQQFDFGPVQALAKLLKALLGEARCREEEASTEEAPPTVLFGYQERDCAARLAFWEALTSHGLAVTERSLVSCAHAACLRGSARALRFLTLRAG